MNESMTSTNSSLKPYWASVGNKDIAQEILDKVDDFYKNIQLNGRIDLYRRSWAYYYRTRLSGARLNATGQQGELTALAVNHYRNLLLHLETMTTQQRPAFEPRATNTDVKSQEQVILATGLLDYYMREKRLEINIKEAVKDALIFGEGFVRCDWDANAGDIYGQNAMGAPVYQGDMKYTNYMPLDVIRDYTKTSSTLLDWYILRDIDNKYDLAAKFTDKADEILSDQMDPLELAETTTLNALGMEETDNIFVYTLLHEPTPAMPKGRYTQILSNGTVLLDGPLPYEKAHVYRLAYDEERGTIFGSTIGFDLLPIQEALDMLYSTATTNQATFGVQNILVPKGHDLSTAQLSGGLNVLEYDKDLGEIKALQLTQTPAEVFNYMQQLQKDMETISGVNSVARGNPEASLKSGAALALVQSQAIQFNQNLQQSYSQLVEGLGTGTINILKAFAKAPRVAAIVGKSNRPMMPSFVGADLDQINRVLVDLGNPLTRTTAGKVNLAEQLYNMQMIENPQQYITVMTTGKFEPVIEATQAQILLVKAENEELADGIPQQAMITEDHVMHIKEHQVVLCSPAAKRNPQLTQSVLAHIQEHMDMMNDPYVQALQQVLGNQVIPSGPPPGMAAPAQPGAVGETLDATNPVTQEAAQVNQPNMPSPPQGADPQSAAIIQAKQGPV